MEKFLQTHSESLLILLGAILFSRLYIEKKDSKLFILKDVLIWGILLIVFIFVRKIHF